MTEIIECLPNDLKLKLKNLYSTYKLDTEIRKDNKGISNVKIYSIRNLANHVLCYGVIENYLYDPIRFNERGYTINVICDSINPKIFNIVYISDIRRGFQLCGGTHVQRYSPNGSKSSR